jgi:RNA polymerase sigma-70 factor (ECF subfamily)
MNTLDAGLLQRAQRGSEEAFIQIVETYQTPVFNLCYRMLGDTQEAEDASQETFWRAYRFITHYDLQRPFITWLLSIASHYCIDFHRKRRLPVLDMELLPEEEAPDIHAPDPEKVTVRSEEERLLHGLLNELRPQDRAALILRYWYDFSDLEISQALSLTVSAVKSRLHRARLLLAQRWKAAQPEYIMKEEPA